MHRGCVWAAGRARMGCLAPAGLLSGTKKRRRPTKDGSPPKAKGTPPPRLQGRRTPTRPCFASHRRCEVTQWGPVGMRGHPPTRVPPPIADARRPSGASRDARRPSRVGHWRVEGAPRDPRPSERAPLGRCAARSGTHAKWSRPSWDPAHEHLGPPAAPVARTGGGNAHTPAGTTRTSH